MELPVVLSNALLCAISSAASLEDVLVDAAQIAHECCDLRAFERVRPLIDLARFGTCPACLDRFDRYEDCPTCAGQGFVTKPAVTGLL